MTISTMPAALTCHPSTPTDVVRGVSASVRWTPARALAFTFLLAADLTRCRIPAPDAPERVDGLWQHTCFEAFLALDDATAYHELNLSPSGDWAIYAFSDYREIGPLADQALPPSIAVRTVDGQLELEAIVRVDRLSSHYLRAPLRIGLSAVIEGADGRLSYWSTHHPPGQPDFHHRDAFAMRLEPLNTAC